MLVAPVGLNAVGLQLATADGLPELEVQCGCPATACLAVMSVATSHMQYWAISARIMFGEGGTEASAVRMLMGQAGLSAGFSNPAQGSELLPVASS